MATPKQIERYAAFTFGVVFLVVILSMAVIFPEPTLFQYEVFKVVLAIASAGVAALVPGFLHVHVGTMVRASGAMGVFAVIYFFTPAQLVVEPPVVSDQAAVFVDIGPLVDSQGIDISAAYEAGFERILSKHGAADPTSRTIVTADAESGIDIALAIFGDLVTATGEAKFEHLRIGVSYGEVAVSGTSVSGSAISAAEHTATDTMLENTGLAHGILVTKSVFDQLGEEGQTKYSIAELKTAGVKKSIYSVPIEQTELGSAGAVQISNPLKSHDDVYIVCVSILEADLKRSAAQQEIQAALSDVIEESIETIVRQANSYEGFFPGTVNKLLFPTASEALGAAVEVLRQTRETSKWHDVLSVIVRVSLHVGPVFIQDGRFAGEAIERAEDLAQQKNPSEFLVISDAAFARIQTELKIDAIPAEGNKMAGKFFLYRPSGS